MKLSILISVGFFLGTFKFMFAHWATYSALSYAELEFHITEIFIAVTIGAWVCMSVFYFSSEYLMRKAKEKRVNLLKAAHANGVILKPQKIFTRTNKFIVWVKQKLGVYGLTFVAPLFLSIPLGSIICAKFIGDNKLTFPLMLFYSGLYGVIQCTLIYLSL